MNGSAPSKKEVRTVRRKGLHQPAWVVLRRGATPLPCLLWDISDTGACLTIGTTTGVPPEFSLFVSKEERRGFQCEVVWRNKLQLGVRFKEVAGGRRKSARVRAEAN